MEKTPDYRDYKDVKIASDIDKAMTDLRSCLGNTMDLNIMNFIVKGVKTAVVTIEGMVSTSSMAELVFRPMMNAEIKEKSPLSLFEFLTEKSLMASERATVFTYGEVVQRLFSGFCVIFTDTVPKAVAYGIQGYEKRSIAEPESEQSLKSSQDSFTETIRTNISLIRRRLKSPSVRFEMMQIGEKSSTDVCMVYMCGRASREIVDEIRKNLKRIKLDTVLSAGYIEPFIDKSYSQSVFSGFISSQRPDLVCNRINEGKVCLLVDGTPYCLICPSLFADNFTSMDDYCEKPFYACFSRWLRYISFFLSVAFPGLYTAVVMFHPEFFTMKLLLNLVASEEATPYPLVIEIVMLMVLLEIMREAGLRLPKAVGSSVSIVGGLIIGDAAVKSGLVSAPLLIVVGITATASFVNPSIYDAVAVLRLIFILAGGFAGLFGIGICTVVLLANISAMNDFAISYTAPVTPFFRNGIKDVLSRRSFKSYEKTTSTVEQYKER